MQWTLCRKEVENNHEDQFNQMCLHYLLCIFLIKARSTDICQLCSLFHYFLHRGSQSEIVLSSEVRFKMNCLPWNVKPFLKNQGFPLKDTHFCLSKGLENVNHSSIFLTFLPLVVSCSILCPVPCSLMEHTHITVVLKIYKALSSLCHYMVSYF